MKDIPCMTCPSMAICNAEIPLNDDPNAIDTFMVYRKCSIMREWGDEYLTTQINENIWITLLKPMKEFFNNVKRSNTMS